MGGAFTMEMNAYARMESRRKVINSLIDGGQFELLRLYQDGDKCMAEIRVSGIADGNSFVEVLNGPVVTKEFLESIGKPANDLKSWQVSSPSGIWYVSLGFLSTSVADLVRDSLIEAGFPANLHDNSIVYVGRYDNQQAANEAAAELRKTRPELPAIVLNIRDEPIGRFEDEFRNEAESGTDPQTLEVGPYLSESRARSHAKLTPGTHVVATSFKGRNVWVYQYSDEAAAAAVTPTSRPVNSYYRTRSLAGQTESNLEASAAVESMANP